MNQATFEKALLDPSAAFPTPSSILDEPLDRDRKLALLRRWQADAERLEESSNEHMSGGEPSRLREVNLALLQLEADAPDA